MKLQKKYFELLNKAVLFLLSAFLFSGALCLLAVSIPGYQPHPGYILDNLSQLRPLYLILVLPLLAACLFLRFPLTGAVSLLVLFINLTAISPYYFPSNLNCPVAGRIKIVSVNLWGNRNKKYDLLLGYIRKTDPDIVCLNEVTRTWMSKLSSALPDYNYIVDEGISGGAAILSRLPMKQLKTSAGFRRYGVQAKVSLGKRELLLIAEHPPSPSRYSNWVNRNAEFERLAAELKTSKLPTVLIGDLNSTPWSAYFKKLEKDAALNDSEFGHGIQASWSTLHPMPLIPIDHCLTKGLCTLSRSAGPNLGSDHLPILVELGIRKEN